MNKQAGSDLTTNYRKNRKSFLLLVSLILFTPLLFLSVNQADAATYLNCGVSEPAINSSSNTLWCDDFEDGNFVLTDDNPSDPLNDGWRHTIFAEAGTFPDPGGHGFGRCQTTMGVATVTGLARTGVAGTNCAGSSGPIGTVKEQSPSMGEHDLPSVINIANPEIYLRYYKKCVSATRCHWTDNTKMAVTWRACCGAGGLGIGATGAFPNGASGATGGPFGTGLLGTCGGTNCMAMHLFNSKVDNQANWLGERFMFQNQNISVDDGSCAVGHTCYEFGDTAHLQHWYYIEHHIRFNSSAGASDGIYELFMDDCGVTGLTGGCATGGTLRTRYTNVRHSTGSNLIGALFFEQHGGNCASGCNQGGEYYFDQFVASKVRVGPMGGGGGGGGAPPDVIPPTPPANLRVL